MKIKNKASMVRTMIQNLLKDLGVNIFPLRCRSWIIWFYSNF